MKYFSLRQLSSIDKLKKWRKTPAAQIEALLAKKAELRQTFPFDLEEKLADSEWVAEKQREYTEQIAATNEQTQSLELFLAETQWSSVELQPNITHYAWGFASIFDTSGEWMVAKKLVTIDPKVLVALHGSFGKDGLPKPFMREILLLDCHVAGTSYLELEEIEKALSLRDTLILQREPDNPHDELAILIHNQNGEKLGYVPQEKNEVLARLMDAGKMVFGVLEEKEWRDSWLYLSIRIYMRDHCCPVNLQYSHKKTYNTLNTKGI